MESILNYINKVISELEYEANEKLKEVNQFAEYGDFSENQPYHTAKADYEFIIVRLNGWYRIKNIIKNYPVYKIGSFLEVNGKVMLLTQQDLVYTIDEVELGFIPIDSPIGKMIINKRYEPLEFNLEGVKYKVQPVFINNR